MIFSKLYRSLNNTVEYFDNHTYCLFVINVLSINVMGLLWVINLSGSAFDGVAGELFGTFVKFATLALALPSIAARVISVPLAIRWTNKRR